MNTEHTPGPWHYEMTTRYGEPSWDIYPPADLPTGSLIPIARGANGNNARLIAAAPDLLAALQKIDANAAESTEWIRRVAQEAIAKATGGAA